MPSGRPRERYGRFAFVRQQERCAHLLGLSENTLKKYLRDGMPGPDAQGWWCVPRCFEWLLLEHGFGRLGGQRDPLVEQLTREKIRRQQIENAVRAGELVSLDEAKQWIEAHVARRIRNAVTELDRRWGPDVGDVVRKAIDEARRELEGGDAADDHR